MLSALPHFTLLFSPTSPNMHSDLPQFFAATREKKAAAEKARSPSPRERQRQSRGRKRAARKDRQRSLVQSSSGHNSHNFNFEGEDSNAARRLKLRAEAGDASDSSATDPSALGYDVIIMDLVDPEVRQSKPTMTNAMNTRSRAVLSAMRAGPPRHQRTVLYAAARRHARLSA